MSMKRIRDVYGVPAKRGGLVKFQGVVCRIASADPTSMHLWIYDLRMPSIRMKVHPAWEMDYDVQDAAILTGERP